MPTGEERRGAVCGKIACTVRCGGGRKPGQSARPCGPGASRRPYRDPMLGSRSLSTRSSTPAIHGGCPPQRKGAEHQPGGLRLLLLVERRREVVVGGDASKSSL